MEVGEAGEVVVESLGHSSVGPTVTGPWRLTEPTTYHQRSLLNDGDQRPGVSA